MKIKQSIDKFLFGTTLPQEYLCIAMEKFSNPYQVILRIPGTDFVKDVTNTHLFLGYKPLAIGIPFEENNNTYHQLLSSTKEIILEFKSGDKSIAKLNLKYFQRKDIENYSLFIFEGNKGKHKFLSVFHRLTNKFRYELKAKRNGNVFLSGNLYSQVQIAYSVPRKISIITLGNGVNYNIFPTDLHGEINKNYYVISLRYEGKASRQVEELKKIALSSVPSEYFSKTYSLGKNHMQELKPADNFKFHELRSEKFKLPLPEMILDYRELEHIDSLICGIHKLHFFKIINHDVIKTTSSTLAHIHKFYVQWRKNNNLVTNYLTR